MTRPTLPLTVDQWRAQGGPDYRAIFAWRQSQLIAIRSTPIIAKGAKEYYRTRPVEFVCDWMTTFDPRNAGKSDKLTFMPFVMFQRQAELIEFLECCRIHEVSGIIPKSRDMGATWTCAGYSVWLWLYVDGATVGWGSRKEQLVDKLGVIDSIFEKIRVLIRWLPVEFKPCGFDEREHATFMRITNPENGNVIGGEAGDNIGRGGRNLVYFKDESAHYQRPELIEAALSANTNVQIDISSVTGLGTVFQRRDEQSIPWFPGIVPEPGSVLSFGMDWRHHPAKTREWYDAAKAKAEREGLLHIFAQEVDCNYASALTCTVIPLEWIDAAVDAHILLGIESSETHIGGLDVADGGNDRNAFAGRRGVVLIDLDEWGAPDVGDTARRAIMRSKGYAAVEYDCIGVGSGVKSEVNRLQVDNFVAWNAGAGVQRPHARLIEGDKQSPKNMDFFHNLKAQGWWSLRDRFRKTWDMVTNGTQYPHDELISLSGSLQLLPKLKKELAQVTYGYSSTLKVLINKTPEGTKSPNLADAVVQAYFPVTDGIAKPVFGTSQGA